MDTGAIVPVCLSVPVKTASKITASQQGREMGRRIVEEGIRT